MEFKKLEIKHEVPWIKRILKSSHFKKSMLFILIGAVAGLIFTLIVERNNLETLNNRDLFTNLFTGAFIGFFLTNSPCARNKC